MLRRGPRRPNSTDNDSAAGSPAAGWFYSLMRQVADGTPGGWAGVAIKYGPAWVLVFWLVNAILTGVTANMGTIAAETKAIRSEHMEFGIYLRGICYGVNREENWRCTAGR